MRERERERERQRDRARERGKTNKDFSVRAPQTKSYQQVPEQRAGPGANTGPRHKHRSQVPAEACVDRSRLQWEVPGPG